MFPVVWSYLDNQKGRRLFSPDFRPETSSSFNLRWDINYQREEVRASHTHSQGCWLTRALTDRRAKKNNHFASQLPPLFLALKYQLSAIAEGRAKTNDQLLHLMVETCQNMIPVPYTCQNNFSLTIALCNFVNCLEQRQLKGRLNKYCK